MISDINHLFDVRKQLLAIKYIVTNSFRKLIQHVGCKEAVFRCSNAFVLRLPKWFKIQRGECDRSYLPDNHP